MESRGHRAIVWPVVVGAAATLLMARPAQALAGGGGFDPEMEYRVTFQTGSNSAQILDRVKVGDIVKIDSRSFLVVYIPGYKTRAYVDFDSVRSIIPASQ